jgi:hypothetical protein
MVMIGIGPETRMLGPSLRAISSTQNPQGCQETFVVEADASFDVARGCVSPTQTPPRARCGYMWPWQGVCSLW